MTAVVMNLILMHYSAIVTVSLRGEMAEDKSFIKFLTFKPARICRKSFH